VTPITTFQRRQPASSLDIELRLPKQQQQQQQQQQAANY
jgi:hypothetical protein